MGGGSKNTTTTTVAEPPKWSVPYFQNFYSNTMEQADKPFTPYTGQMIADFTPQQVYGMDYAQQVAMGGTPYADLSMQAGANIMNNPIYNQMVDYGGGNDYLGMVNPYSGANPYLENMISSATQGVVDDYMNATAPQLQALGMQQGAFGNTGLQQMQLQAANDLTGSLGDIQNEFRFQDYTTQQQLAENFLNRNSALSEQIANRVLNASGQNAANNLTAQQIDQQGDLAAMGMAPQLEQLRYLPSEQMMTLGDLVQQQNQSYLNNDYERFMAEQMYPYQQLDLQQNALATIMGSGGTTTTSAPNANYGNTAANLLGGGLMTYGLFS